MAEAAPYRRPVVYCGVCGRFFLSKAGLSSHSRGTRCIPLQLAQAVQALREGIPLPDAPNRATPRSPEPVVQSPPPVEEEEARQHDDQTPLLRPKYTLPESPNATTIIKPLIPARNRSDNDAASQINQDEETPVSPAAAAPNRPARELLPLVDYASSSGSESSNGSGSASRSRSGGDNGAGGGNRTVSRNGSDGGNGTHGSASGSGSGDGDGSGNDSEPGGDKRSGGGGSVGDAGPASSSSGSGRGNEFIDEGSAGGSGPDSRNGSGGDSRSGGSNSRSSLIGFISSNSGSSDNTYDPDNESSIGGGSSDSYSSESSNSILYYTADYGSDSDDFSVVSENILCNVRLNEQDFVDQQYATLRRDGRNQHYADVARRLVEEFYPRIVPLQQPNWVKKIIFGFLQLMVLLVFTGCKYAFIYSLAVAFWYCHNGQCTTYVNYFMIDIAAPR